METTPFLSADQYGYWGNSRSCSTTLVRRIPAATEQPAPDASVTSVRYELLLCSFELEPGRPRQAAKLALQTVVLLQLLELVLYSRNQHWVGAQIPYALPRSDSETQLIVHAPVAQFSGNKALLGQGREFRDV